ncbi:MAG: dephospho-CoA kinase [Ginsengibacter sp.]
MLKIGLTGGIGSGKSTVATMFEVLGIPVYYADAASKRLMIENEELRSSILKHFGEDAYANGILNRKFLAQQVFNDSQKIELLNSLVHPVTMRDAAGWIEMQTAPYVIKEAALIFESGSNKFLDYVIGVDAPRTLRIQRTMDRDKISAQEVEARMSKQMDESEKMRLCDFVIVNDEQQIVIQQVLALHEKFLEMEMDSS